MKILRVFFAKETAEAAIKEIDVQISLNAPQKEISVQTKNRELEKFLRNRLAALWPPNLIESRGILDENEILWKIQNQLKQQYPFNGFRIKNFVIQNL